MPVSASKLVTLAQLQAQAERVKYFPPITPDNDMEE